MGRRDVAEALEEVHRKRVTWHPGAPYEFCEHTKDMGKCQLTCVHNKRGEGDVKESSWGMLCSQHLWVGGDR